MPPQAEKLRATGITATAFTFNVEMVVNRGMFESASSTPGRASELELTVTDSTGQTRQIEPICAPLTDPTLNAVPNGGSVTFTVAVPWNRLSSNGNFMQGNVTVVAKASIQAFHDTGEHKALSGESLETFTAVRLPNPDNF